MAKRLDSTLLAQLIAGGYVPNEAAARATVRQQRAANPLQPSTRLFGTRRFVPPTPPAISAAAPAAGQGQTPQPVAPLIRPPTGPAGGVAPAGTVLLMRLRKASMTDRPTQTQIPFRVGDTFFQGATVRSAHDNVSHGIISASARGGRNTIKLEIPEMRTFADPVARFERTPAGIVYETYDVGSPRGNQILQSLQAGQQNGSTQHSISDLPRATWWRFI